MSYTVKKQTTSYSKVITEESDYTVHKKKKKEKEKEKEVAPPPTPPPAAIQQPQEIVEVEVEAREETPVQEEVKVVRTIPKIGINGFGRIGRLVLRAAMKSSEVQVVAINDAFLDVDYMVYLFTYDSVHGRYPGTVRSENGQLVVDDQYIACYKFATVSQIPWSQTGVDHVVEATGVNDSAAKSRAHINGTVRKVVITAPTDDCPMIVYGVNENTYDNLLNIEILSACSDTTNCLAPVAKVLNDNFGIEEGLMTTVHAYTSTQKVIDSAHFKDWRMGRAAGVNVIPTTTSASKCIGQILPEIDGRMMCMAFRVPVPSGSVIDLTCRLTRNTPYDQIKVAMKNAAYGAMRGIMEYTEEKIVSTDCIGNPHSAIFDADAGIQLNPSFVKVIAWFDNEYGYSHRVIDIIRLIGYRES